MKVKRRNRMEEEKVKEDEKERLYRKKKQAERIAL